MAKVGFFQKDITPPLGWPLDGSCYREMHTTAVRDPLFLRIMTLHDDHGRMAALVTADLLYFPRDMNWRIKRWIADELDQPEAAIILNGSHTHTGPFLHPNYDPPEVAYVESIEQAIRAGVRQAMAEAEPAQIRYALLQVDIGVSRRLPRGDGTVERMMRPNEAGYYDPDLPVLAVYDASGASLRGLWFSYACHPTGRRGPFWSADFPGGIVRNLKQRLGEHVQAHFAQGAGGDIKPRFYDRQTQKFVFAEDDQIDAMGRKVADQVAAALEAGAFKPIDLDLAFAEKEFDVPYDMARVPSVKQLTEMAQAQEDASLGVTPRCLRYWARKMLDAIHMGRLKDHHRMMVTRIRLNRHLQIIALSDEVVAELGRMVKDCFPPGEVILLGYSGFTEVYVPVSRMLVEGGYEPVASLYYTIQHNLQTSTFMPQVEDQVKAAVLSAEY